MLCLQAWGNIRAEFAEQLRQPLCLALLRNCTSPYDEAYTLVWAGLFLHWPLLNVGTCCTLSMVSYDGISSSGTFVCCQQMFSTYASAFKAP